MPIRTVNPYNQRLLMEYQEETVEAIAEKISRVRQLQQLEWGKNIDLRLDYLKNHLKPRLEGSIDGLARLMSSEMGKPISQSVSEIKKCIWLVDFAVENYKKFLEKEFVQTEAKRSYVRFDPLGVVMLVMPWNFPLWQVMRAAIPALAAGNGVVLKHASIVTGSSLKIEEMFDTPLFKSLVISGASLPSVIKHVDGISFTGSTETGARLAQDAGKELKKLVLELGGSDPFVVLESANVETAAKQATLARLQNNGQSCIASKRFIVSEKIYDEFHAKLKEEFRAVVVGDQLDTKTYLGPLASKEQAEIVSNQIEELRSIGRVEMLSEKKGNIVPPTIVATEKDYPEEIFGPVALLRKFKDTKDAIRLANDSPFGLGSSIWGDADEAEKMAPEIQAGMVFINKMVASDPRLPFGGVKKSGLGRELSRYGLLEFTNIKTVWVQ